MDSCFALLGTRQHFVAKICNASPRANVHKFATEMIRSLYQVPYFEPTCAPKHALPHYVFRCARRPEFHDWRLEKQKVIVVGQGQPKHLNIDQPCSLLSLHFFLADLISCRSYVGSVYHMRSLAVSRSLIYKRS